jgi:hypothetical protein
MESRGAFFLDADQLQIDSARLNSLRTITAPGGTPRPWVFGGHACRPIRLALRSTPMSSVTPSPEFPDDDLDEPIPAMQQLLDNPFLLHFLGIAMPTVLYIIWGVMEIVGIPIAK